MKDNEKLWIPKITFEIEEERKRQWAKWGQQDRTIAEWLLIATEEFGEFAKEANIVHFSERDENHVGYFYFKKELMQAITVLFNIYDMVIREEKVIIE